MRKDADGRWTVSVYREASDDSGHGLIAGILLSPAELAAERAAAVAAEQARLSNLLDCVDAVIHWHEVALKNDPDYQQAHFAEGYSIGLMKKARHALLAPEPAAALEEER